MSLKSEALDSRLQQRRRNAEGAEHESRQRGSQMYLVLVRIWMYY